MSQSKNMIQSNPSTQTQQNPPPYVQQPEQPLPNSEQQPQKTNQPKRKSNSLSKPPKLYDTLLDNWYYTEVNKRINEAPEIFKNYQINPYTKKTLEFVTPKITERRRPIPKEPCCDPSRPDYYENQKPLTEDEQSLIKSYKLVKRAIERSITTPQTKYCEPMTEAMRLGWYPKLGPPPTNLQCMYILPYLSPTPCCYFHPKPYQTQTQNESYDERFRAVHQTAEFIRTETKLRHFDSVMNPKGHRGKIITDRKRPSSFSRNPPPPPPNP